MTTLCLGQDSLQLPTALVQSGAVPAYGSHPLDGYPDLMIWEAERVVITGKLLRESRDMDRHPQGAALGRGRLADREGSAFLCKAVV
ncbi:MAG: hypothetical protein IOC80_13190 [Rhodobacter sp.]|nr:hypothetical protein [Rhodobacter sp.]MCA3515136.1 hypothetical protein [Rhodobacter sp.]MCA3521138.1 hypothetical protein [Rhodobacter sp.]MCA3523125.1 hypothetical protein [Rhodobacter sp.]MCA3525424.1 hypothetical protein [Rhodobacter sp.]